MARALEHGPIRPPSEAKSLLLRVTRNCPWNRCEFCGIYKARTFSRRSLEEIKQEIQTIRGIYDEIQALSWRQECAGVVNDDILQVIWSSPGQYDESFRSVAIWMYFGAQQVFLQDANSLIIETDVLAQMLHYLREVFPCIKRVTSYARSSTLNRKPIEELVTLKNAGLNRIHVGMESGYDNVLKFMNKGVTAADQVEAGKKVVASGISLCEYMLLGLGGKKWWKEHAVESAKVLNQINPHFIRIRTLTIREGMPLNEKLSAGEFQLQSEEEIVQEERLFIEHLEGITSYLKSDHILNLLEEVEGQFPQDREKMLSVIDEYLRLPRREQLIYNLGRRGQVYRCVGDLTNTNLRKRVELALDEFIAGQQEDLDRAFNNLRNDFI
jgi:radical SAM superfamily enzyme YgiQ (UPF0313 family)